MGFFSSRRHDTDTVASSPSAQPQRSSPSPGIIRSRFYGRNKGKAREANPPPTPTRGRAASPLAEPRKERDFDDNSRTINGRRATDNSGAKVASESPSHSSSPQQSSRSQDSANARASTDAMTVALAQRLTELASANAEGLLDDDEYRLLRQNLFERLGNSTIPRKKPAVPTAGPSRSRPPETPKRSGSLRSSSLQSKGTISSSVSGLFRRSSRREASTADADTLHSDSTSLLSTGSNSPNNFTHRLLRISLTKQSSVVSLKLDSTSAAHHNGSTPYLTSHSRSDGPGKPITPSISRSSTTRSKRKEAPPPSAFHNRTNGVEQRRAHSGLLDDDLDDDVLKSSKEIRAQIEAVEAEGRRLMDAFNGLELSTLTRRSQANNITVLPSTAHFLQGLDSSDYGWSSQSSKDVDGVSMRSTTSNGTSHRSPVRSPRSTANPPLVSQPVSLGRKSSLSSISSKGRGGPASGAPYLPALPSSLGRLWSGSSSSVNLTRSATHLPLAPVAEGDSRESIEGHKRHLRLDTSPSALLGPTSASPRKNGVIDDDGDIVALEAEMAEIRRRRAEVMARYEERLGYLRAKLKGAELHEKLLRR